VKTVVRQAHQETLYAEAAEAFLEAHPDEMVLREDLAQWYLEDAPDDEGRRRQLAALFEHRPTDDEVYHDLLAMTDIDQRAPILRIRMNATTDDDERQKLRSSLGLALASSSNEEERNEAQRLLEAFRMTQSTHAEVNRTLRKLLAEGGHWGQLASL